jgi:hypothetical protein
LPECRENNLPVARACGITPMAQRGCRATLSPARHDAFRGMPKPLRAFYSRLIEA